MAEDPKSKVPRLQFSKEELEEPALEKPRRKVLAAGEKLDKAESKIPSRNKLRIEHATDAKTGKSVARLRFGKVTADNPAAPAKGGRMKAAMMAAPASLLNQQKKQEATDRESRVGDVGAEVAGSAKGFGEKAFHVGEAGAERVRYASERRPYRAVKKAEKRLDKANVRYLEKKAGVEAHTKASPDGKPQKPLRNTRTGAPDFSGGTARGTTGRAIQGSAPGASSPLSRRQQRRAIQRQYAAMKRAEGAASGASTGTGLVGSVREKISQGFRNNKRTLVMGGLLFMMLAMVMNGISSCSPIVQGGFQAIAVSTYPAEEADMLAAERMYAAMESELQDTLNWYEWNHDYDEYHFDLDEIWHDPHALMAIVSAWYGGEPWTADQVYGTLEMLFGWQYKLTEKIKTETRYRPEERTGYNTVTDPVTGATSQVPYTYYVDVPFTYYIANVQLINQNLSYAPIYIMNEERIGMYAMYKSTLGNHPDLFRWNRYSGKLKDPLLYDVPQEVLDEYPILARLLEEAEKYLGYPYVWGGSKPTTSFDCSGFISWVFTQSGVLNTGRLGATSLYGVCTPITPEEAQPGDMVFFQGTLPRNEGITHVGLYVGDGMMIHCGDPITYADITDGYFSSHFFGFGRPRL